MWFSLLSLGFPWILWVAGDLLFNGLMQFGESHFFFYSFLAFSLLITCLVVLSLNVFIFIIVINQKN